MTAPASADGSPRYGGRPVPALAVRSGAAHRVPTEFLRHEPESGPAQALSYQSVESGLSAHDRRRAVPAQLFCRRRRQRHCHRHPAARLSISGTARTPANHIQVIEASLDIDWHDARCRTSLTNTPVRLANITLPAVWRKVAKENAIS